jgi:predicted Zn-dependent protease
MTAADGSFSLEVGSPRTDDWLDPGMGGSSTGTVEDAIRSSGSWSSFSLGRVPTLGYGRASLTGCEVRAAPRPGQTSNVINLDTKSSFEDPDIGVIIIRRLSNPGARTVSLSTLGAPKKAQSAFDQASAELREEKPDLKKVKKELKTAVEEYPEFSAAWDLLGRIQMSEGNIEDARQSLLQAVASEPEFINPYMALAQLCVHENSWPETADWTRKVLELDSAHPKALYWNGLANYYLGRYDQGEATLSKLYSSGHAANYPFGLLPLGAIHANQGKIQRAANELTLYLELMPSDQVSEAQRTELEQQLAHWKSEGITVVHQQTQPNSEAPQ